MEPTFIANPEGWSSEARHWELPFRVEARRGLTKWVITSQVKDEVLIFPADKYGQPLEWAELYSTRGENLDAETVLKDFIATQENKETE